MSAVPARPALTPASAWWHASRPATLAASVSPVLAGTAIALHDGPVRPLPGLAALVVALSIQLGVNYANDYSDFVRGADGASRVGPPRAAASGLVPPARVRAAALGAFGLAGVVGLGLALSTDPRLLLPGALALAAGWLYTGGPRPYGYLGLGEVFVFLFFGLLATCGTAYVQQLRVSTLCLLAGSALGFLACAILVLNNLRDVETDRAAGKRTLAVRLGRRRTRVMLALLLAAAFACPLLAPWLARAGWPVLLPVLTGTMALAVLRGSAATQPAALVGALKRCAQLECWFAILLAAGVLAS